MSELGTRKLSKNGGIKRNSYYDVSKPYSQKELDDYRISEGYSKEIRIYFNPGRKADGNRA